MSFVSANASDEAVQKFLEILQNDFRTLATETKKKYPQIKEVRMSMQAKNENADFQKCFQFILSVCVFFSLSLCFPTASMFVSKVM